MSRTRRGLARVGRALGRGVAGLVLPAGLVGLWWATSESRGPFENDRRFVYPALSDVVEALEDNWLFERVGSDLLPSLGRFGAGYLLAVVAGIGLGTLIGLAPRLRQASQPVTEFLRSIPPPLLLPFVLVTMGAGNDSKVVLIALGAVWPVLLNTVDGVRGVDPETLEMSRSFRIPRRTEITHVVLPAASPKITVGMRTAVSIALILMIISEMQASDNGLGYQVRSAQLTQFSAKTYAGVIVIGVVGLAVNAVFLRMERWVMRWHRGARGLLDDGRPGR
jgi:ABC-type nitrate/sulfonate/bicarbonate transport system permease component